MSPLEKEETSNNIIVFLKTFRRSKMFKVFMLIVTINVVLGVFYAIFEDLPFHLSLYWATDTITNTGTGLVLIDEIIFLPSDMR